MDLNELTIFITTYNSSNRINDLLNLLNNFNIKTNILIADDFSTDNTIDLIKKNISAKKYSNLNIKIIVNKKNVGLAMNRMNNIKFVETKYFIFLDDDDYLDLNIILESKNKWIDNNISIFNRVEYNNKKVKKITHKSKNGYFKYSIWNIWGIIFKTSFYNQQPIKFLKNNNIGEDINSYSILSNNDFKIIKSKLPAYIYIKRTNSLRTKIKERKKEIVNNIINCVNNINNKKNKDKILSCVLSYHLQIFDSNDFKEIYKQLNINKKEFKKSYLFFKYVKNKNPMVFIFSYFWLTIIIFRIFSQIKNNKKLIKYINKIFLK